MRPESSGLLNCYVVSSGKQLPTFRRAKCYPPSGSSSSKAVLRCFETLVSLFKNRHGVPTKKTSIFSTVHDRTSNLTLFRITWRTRKWRHERMKMAKSVGDSRRKRLFHYVTVDTAYQPRKLQSSAPSMTEPQISHCSGSPDVYGNDDRRAWKWLNQLATASKTHFVLMTFRCQRHLK